MTDKRRQKTSIAVYHDLGSILEQIPQLRDIVSRQSHADDGMLVESLENCARVLSSCASLVDGLASGEDPPPPGRGPISHVELWRLACAALKDWWSTDATGARICNICEARTPPKYRPEGEPLDEHGEAVFEFHHQRTIEHRTACIVPLALEILEACPERTA